MWRAIYGFVCVGLIVAINLAGPPWLKSNFFVIVVMLATFLVGFFVLGLREENQRLKRKAVYPRFDHGAGNPHLPQAIDALWKQDWAELSRIYRKQAPSDRFVFIEALGATSVVDTPLPEDQSDSGALTICGGLKTGHAWRFRGGGGAETVTSASAVRMIDCLSEAQQALAAALAINPQDSTALAFMIRAEMGLRGDRDVLDGALERAQGSFETNLFVAANHLQFVTPKWHGSVEEMWQVANRWASTPPNAAWLAIAARAHIEEWLFCFHFDVSRRQAMVAKMQDDGYLRHVAELDDLFWKSVSEQPILGAEASFAYNNFAFLMNTMGLKERVKPHLERIGPHITTLPWGYTMTGAAEPMHLLALLRKAHQLAPLKA